MKKIFYLFIASAFLFGACSDDTPTSGTNNDGNGNGNGNGNINPGSLSIEINGETWTALQSALVCNYTNDPQLGDIVDIQGTAADGSQITLAISGIDPGVYQFNPDSLVFDGIVSYTYKEDGQNKTPFMKSSQVTITSHDAAKKQLSGSFQFTSDNDAFIGVNGSFGMLQYTEK